MTIKDIKEAFQFVFNKKAESIYSKPEQIFFDKKIC